MTSKRAPWKKLFSAALRARRRAYAPYSRFAVGAAILLEDGAIEAGCNVENSSFGVSICAERVAICAALAHRGIRKIMAMVVVTDTPSPCPPCGMCRQMIAEFAGVELEVRSQTLAGSTGRYTFEELFPHPFSQRFL